MVISVDHHALSFITVFGLVLGVLGSLYLTYDLLGRTQVVLRWFVRVSMPAFVGMAPMALCGAVVYAVVYPTVDAGLGAALYGSIGCLIGVFNGLFVNPNKPQVAPFSLLHAIAGMLIAFFCIILGSAPLTIVLRAPWSLGLNAALFAAALGFLAGGVWGFINRVTPLSNAAQSLFSWRGAVIGLIGATILSYAVLIAIDIAYGVPLLTSAQSALKGALFALPVGALVGGSSRFIFWRASSLDGYGLGAIGVILTLIGFAVQLVEPLVSLFDIPVK